jgi:hypothetical protein
MVHFDAARPFPASLVYPDVAEDILAREEAGDRTPQSALADDGAWGSYLQRILPLARPDPVVVAPGAEDLATRRGMAQFLLSTGPAAAHAFTDGMRATAAASRDFAAADFWAGVAEELPQARR